MGKISTSFDMLQLIGAQLITSTKTQHRLLVIDLDDNSSRLRVVNKRDGTVGAYCALDVVPLRQMRDNSEDTHFVCERTTKQEREEGLKLPIVGNGREYLDNPSPQGQQQQRQPPPQRQQQATQLRQQYQQPAQRQNAPQQPAQRPYTPPAQQGQYTTPPQQQPAQEEEHSWGVEGDDIPF